MKNKNYPIIPDSSKKEKQMVKTNFDFYSLDMIFTNDLRNKVEYKK